MKRKSAMLTALILSIVMLFASSAFADTGPKPSVNVSFENMADEPCYATLLSKRQSTGPYYVLEGEPTYEAYTQIYSELDYDIWEKFVKYEDSDGYYFLQEGWRVDATKSFSWSYYPPDEFKILLYYPGTDTFVSSACLERYAFNSYYTVDLNGFEISHGEENKLPVVKSYKYGGEIVSLLVRIVLTVAIEILVAVLFGYREKKQLKLITLVNIITQILLNVFLNIAHFKFGAFTVVFLMVIGELAVFTVETIIYTERLNKIAEKQRPKWLAAIYAITANTASLILGRMLLLLLPLE